MVKMLAARDASGQFDVLQSVGEALARGAKMVLVRIVDDVQVGAVFRKFRLPGMPHQFEQALCVHRCAPIIIVEWGGVGAPLEPEISIVVAVEAVETPAPLQRCRVAAAKPPDKGPHGDAAPRMAGNDKV